MDTQPIDEEFANMLEDTARLLKYFPEGYDFGVDPFDPVVEDFLEVIDETAKQEGGFERLFEQQEFAFATIRGMLRHIDMEQRVRLYDRLEALLEEVKPEDEEILRVALRATEHTAVPLFMLGLTRIVYQKHVIGVPLYKRKSAPVVLSGETLAELKSRSTRLSSKARNEIIRHGPPVLSALEELSFDEDADMDKIISLAAEIPCFHSAQLIMRNILDAGFDTPELAKICRRSGILPLVAICVINELEKGKLDFVDRWQLYGYLFEVKEPRLFGFLRKEFVKADHECNLREEDKLDATLAFCKELCEWLIALDDRRAVPVFIRFLHEGRERGFAEPILEAVREKVLPSSWGEEITKGLMMLKEGETIFITEKDRPGELMISKVEADTELRSVLGRGPATLADLQERAKSEQKRWNEAYHEALDGLRPIDMPMSRVNLEMLQLMVQDFSRSVANQKFSSPKEMASRQQEFQKEWMITPLRQRHGIIPLVMILKDEGKLATTQALKDNFNRYEAEQTQNLYLEARERFDQGDLIGAKRRVAALVQLEPKDPFARRLKKAIEAANGDN